MYKRQLQPLLERDVQSIILGCTHYPLLVPLLRQLLPETVRLIDPAVAVAHQLDALLGSPSPGEGPATITLRNCRFCVTADAQGFAARSEPWLGQRPAVQLVDLRSRSEGH